VNLAKVLLTSRCSLIAMEQYDFEIEQVVKKIKLFRAKTVLLQFPDGLKPHATDIVEELQKRVKADFIVWAGTCYGACDIPSAKADLLVQFGHTEMR
jgi:2-(3-amino-3-carboxypropyl)histidine synthase